MIKIESHPKTHWLPSCESISAYCGQSSNDLLYDSSFNGDFVNCKKCLKIGQRSGKELSTGICESIVTAHRDPALTAPQASRRIEGQTYCSDGT
jgi:hypothetical protein